MKISSVPLLCIVALRNEKGSYNKYGTSKKPKYIVALRNEKKA